MTGIWKCPDYEQHPIAIKLMPGGMNTEEFAALGEDIEARGCIMPITIFEGKVLDGWHRYRHCRTLGVAFKELAYTGNDPAGYIASVNVLRRRLGSLQRCLVAARLHLDHNFSQREVCKKLGVSNEVVVLVLKAINSGNTKLIKRIEDDSDFSRGMLREELADAGLTRPKKAQDAPLQTPNSVFHAGQLSAAAAAAGLEGILGRAADTDGIGEDDDDADDELPDTGKGLKANKRKEHKPRATAAQLLAEQFQALTLDEKQSFLTLISPTVRSMRDDGYKIGCDPLPAAKAPNGSKKTMDATDAFIASAKPAAKKTSTKKPAKAEA